MPNSNFLNKSYVIVFLGFFIALFFFPYKIYSIDKAGPIDQAGPKNNILAKKFKSLGIIRLAGIAPPASLDLFDMDGNPVKFSDFNGKIVFINFWTTWCPDCVYEMPDIEKLHTKIKNPDFIILAVDLRESSKKVNKFMQKHNLTFKILIDEKGDTGRAFAVRSIPTTFIMNRQGGLIGKAMGVRKWGSKKSIDLFEYLLENNLRTQ